MHYQDKYPENQTTAITAQSKTFAHFNKLCFHFEHTLKENTQSDQGFYAECVVEQVNLSVWAGPCLPRYHGLMAPC